MAPTDTKLRLNPESEFPLGATAKQYLGIGTLNVQTVRGEVKAHSTDWIVTFQDGSTVVLPDSLFMTMFRGNAYVERVLAERQKALDLEVERVQAQAEKREAIERRVADGTEVVYDAAGEAAFVEADGTVTDYDGNVYPDTPENRLRFPTAYPEVVPVAVTEPERVSDFDDSGLRNPQPVGEGATSQPSSPSPAPADLSSMGLGNSQ